MYLLVTKGSVILPDLSCRVQQAPNIPAMKKDVSSANKHLFRLKILTLLLIGFAHLTKAQISTPGPILTCPGHGQDMNSVLEMPSAMRANLQSIGNANSTIIVNYSGFTPQAQQAFQYAVNIWQSVLVSSVPIRINASWEQLEAGTLGAAGASTLYRDFREALTANVWYPVALAERLTSRELNPASDPDIIAQFNSNVNWYFGTDGRTPPGQYSLVTVVLHEIAHGLGFFSSFDIENNQGLWGEETGYAFIYDYFIENGANQRLTNTALFPSPSTALANQLTSNSLFFDTNAATNFNNTPAQSTLARLYAPNVFTIGSSISHLDESRYPAGDENALMTPQIGRAESIYWPGTLTLQMLTTMGWRTRTPESGEEPIAVFPNPTGGNLTIDGFFQENITQLSITISDLVGKPLLTSRLSGTRRYFTEQFDMSNFPAGIYLVNINTGRDEFTRRVMVTR
jgi:hypothetical protein